MSQVRTSTAGPSGPWPRHWLQTWPVWPEEMLLAHLLAGSLLQPFSQPHNQVWNGAKGPWDQEFPDPLESSMLGSFQICLLVGSPRKHFLRSASCPRTRPGNSAPPPPSCPHTDRALPLTATWLSARLLAALVTCPVLPCWVIHLNLTPSLPQS